MSAQEPTTSSIYELSHQDLTKVLKLNREVIAESSNLNYSDPDKLVADYLSVEKAQLLVIRVLDGSGIVAMLGYKRTQIDVYGEDPKEVIKMNLLRVALEERGKGIASSLIEHVEGIARTKGITEVHLSVESTDPAALYEK